MSRSKIFYPIIILIFSVAALATSLFLYIYWYLAVSEGLNTVVKNFKLDKRQVLEPQTWIVILVLSILVGFIIICIIIIFVYNQKNLRLYRMQHNFINNFTHELKTPVTSLKLYLETFLKYQLSREEQEKYIGYMLQDAARLTGNISRILNLAQIEGKSYREESVITDLVELTRLFLQNNQHLFQDSEITIHNHSEKRVLYSIKLGLYEILLMNLLTNAIKYNRSGKPTVDISFEHERSSLLIKFADNGIGIEKTNLKKIFKKFYQIGQPENMSAKGTGIGLYMADNIARIHKGRIRAESGGDGKGSVFTLILPYFSQ
ncbi:HAMP domain-containing histidine kinase [bacterium]|nr:HAMP domain-containing histidine kinase [bacterium]